MIKCEFENGVKANLRHVTVDALVVDKSGTKILLVKRAEKLVEGGKWAMPGGFLDMGERAEKAVLRELKEETGFDGLILKLFRINTRPDRKGEDRQNVAFVFLVTVSGNQGKGDWEVDAINWWHLSELKGEYVAFDHFENIELYLKYTRQAHTLPIID